MSNLLHRVARLERSHGGQAQRMIRDAASQYIRTGTLPDQLEPRIAEHALAFAAKVTRVMEAIDARIPAPAGFEIADAAAGRSGT